MKYKKGFTLIELILSIAIIGMIAVAMLPAFNMSIKNIVSAGHRTGAVGHASEDIINNTLVTPFEFIIELPNSDDTGTLEVIVQGNQITGTSEIEGSGGKTVDIYVHNPILN